MGNCLSSENIRSDSIVDVEVNELVDIIDTEHQDVAIQTIHQPIYIPLPPSLRHLAKTPVSDTVIPDSVIQKTLVAIDLLRRNRQQYQIDKDDWVKEQSSKIRRMNIAFESSHLSSDEYRKKVEEIRIMILEYKPLFKKEMNRYDKTECELFRQVLSEKIDVIYECFNNPPPILSYNLTGIVLEGRYGITKDELRQMTNEELRKFVGKFIWKVIQFDK